MARKTLNLGILAHVDAGKTTLTERLLYAAGVIDEIGSVDKGTTQTDSLALERQRGITIKSAVVSFAIDDVTVNLIDTPGHPDFIAEVERVLSVLDGAVLVVSAVEGVQPQTRVLMRALQRLRVPTLVFVNKIDRAGAGDERVLRAISERLTPAIVQLGSVQRPRDARRRLPALGRGRRRLRGQAGSRARRERRRAPGRVRRRRGEPAVLPAPRGSRRPDRAGAGASRVLRLRADRSRSRRAHGRHRGVAAGCRGRRRRPRLGHGLQDRTRRRRREDRLRPDVLGDGANARPAALRRGRRGKGHGDQRLRPRVERAARGRLRRRDREALGSRRGPDRRPHRSRRERRRPGTGSLRRPSNPPSFPATPTTRGRSASRSPSSPSRTRSSTCGRTTPAESSRSRSTARCRRR